MSKIETVWRLDAEQYSHNLVRKQPKKHKLVDNFEKFTAEDFSDLKLLNLKGLLMKNSEKPNIRQTLLRAFKMMKSLETWPSKRTKFKSLRRLTLQAHQSLGTENYINSKNTDPDYDEAGHIMRDLYRDKVGPPYEDVTIRLHGSYN